MGEPGFAMVHFPFIPLASMTDMKVYPWLAKVTGHEYHAVHYDRVYPEEEWTRPDGSPVVSQWHLLISLWRLIRFSHKKAISTLTTSE
jgi:hypothetical protein